MVRLEGEDHQSRAGETGVWPKLEFGERMHDSKADGAEMMFAKESVMKLGLVVDLDTCVGCHACAVACKEWNGKSLMAGGAPDYDPYGAEPSGVWFNRIRHYEVLSDELLVAADLVEERQGLFVASADDVQDGQCADVVHALRRCRLRHRVSDRCFLQARRGRHRHDRSRKMHGLQLLCLGLSVRCP